MKALRCGARNTFLPSSSSSSSSCILPRVVSSSSQERAKSVAPSATMLSASVGGGSKRWFSLATVMPAFDQVSEVIKLNNISDNEGARKKRKRVGRGIGSGRGKTCGRGHKVRTLQRERHFYFAFSPLFFFSVRVNQTEPIYVFFLWNLFCLIGSKVEEWG